MPTTPPNQAPPQKSRWTLPLLAGVVAVVIAGVGISLVRCKPTEPGTSIPWNEPAQETAQVSVFFTARDGVENVAKSVVRNVEKGEDPMKVAIQSLLNGPTQTEQEKGYFNEIPPNTRLISIFNGDSEIRVNFSGEFESGGGSNSIRLRMEQVIKTIQALEKNKPVYVEVDGRELNVLGGEGLEVPEPVNQDNAV